jgi:Flp pilus assembly protein TadD
VNASIAELRRALEERPPTADGHARLGTALLKAGATREAERELRKAIDLDPRCAGAWVNLGGILYSRWEFGASVEANRRAAAAEPTLALAHFNQAIGHLHLGQPDQVVECLGRVIELEPGNGAAYHHLAIALHALGRSVEARLCATYAGELGYRPSPVSAQALASAEAASALADKAEPTSNVPQSKCCTHNTQGEGNGTAQGR